MRIQSTLGLFTLTAVLAACSPAVTPSGYAGHLYAMTNAATGNAIVHYGRGADGKLSTLESTGTGGVGLGGVNVVTDDPAVKAADPLFSNDSLLLSPDHRLLFAVNAGSNTVSSFTVAADGSLKLVGTPIATGGVQPTGLAYNGTTLYVGHAKANAQGNQLTGFNVGPGGALSAISGAAYKNQGPNKSVITHSLFSPDGKQLVVIELMNDTIDVYPVNADGTLGTPKVNTFKNSGPFGAYFVGNAGKNVLLVTEVGAMNAVNAGAASSFALAADGTLTAISKTVGNSQNATCWIIATPDGKYAYASNTASGTVSAYSLDASQNLQLVNSTSATRAGQNVTTFDGKAVTSGPVDTVLSADGKFFYQQYSGLGVVGAYKIGADGNLTAIAGGDATDLPEVGSEGLAGY